MSSHIHIPLEEGCYYHIYNQGNDRANIFYQQRNYVYFLKRYDEYLSDYLKTYAYALLPNHFHLLIRGKSKSDFPVRAISFPKAEDLETLSAGTIVSELFKRFFLSYSKSINVQQGRKGSLFLKNFRRKLADNDRYFTTLVYYIHHQLKHHGFTGLDDKNYPWNSYGRLLMPKSSKLVKQQRLEWFGGKDHFVRFHEQSQDLSIIKDLTIEDEE